jgi:hypothetical protein
MSMVIRMTLPGRSCVTYRESAGRAIIARQCVLT